jgi:hypothetical protein
MSARLVAINATLSMDEPPDLEDFLSAHFL